MTLRTLLSGLALAGVLVGCGSGTGGGDAANEIATPATDIQASAEKADKPALETKVASYETTIKDYEKQIEDLLAKAKDAMKDTALGDMLGDDAKKAKDLAAKYTDEADALKKDLVKLKERLDIYAAELKKKVAGA
jgi:predicted  nucleic acid-binding Zn-ribbon protein